MMKVTILHSTPDTAIVKAAQVCRNSDNPDKALAAALSQGHDSLKEHWMGQFLIEGISRNCSHQLVRHRIASFAQSSQRSIKIDIGSSDWYVVPPNASPLFHSVVQAAGQSYLQLIADGMSIEDARYVLPGACKTNLVMTINARSLDNFFKLRCCKSAQWEIRELAEKMLRLVRKETYLFDGVYPECTTCLVRCQ